MVVRFSSRFAGTAGTSRPTLDGVTALRAFTRGPGVREVLLRHLGTPGDGLGGIFVAAPDDLTSADDGVNVIRDDEGVPWFRLQRNVGKGFTRLPEREAVRTLESRFGSIVDVLDFEGADPTGAHSSRAAIQAAVDEWRSFSVGGGQGAAVLYFPPNMSRTGRYVLDGSVNMTSVRGYMNTVLAHGAVFFGSAENAVIFDATHCNQIDWRGGQIIGDAAAVPSVGLQLARQYSGDPLMNPSSHHHRIDGLTVAGHWSRACIYNYGSEENLFTYCYLRNERADMNAYCLIQDGQSGVFDPQSAFVPAGFADYTGFANNVFDKCSFWRIDTDGSGTSGPAIFLSRAQGQEFRACLTQTRKAPTVVVHHVAGERGLQDIRFDCRCETEEASSIFFFTGGDGAVHRGLEVQLDRMFAQRLFHADSSLSADSVSLIDTRVRVRNIFPGSATANTNGITEIFANRTKFARVSGDFEIGTKNTDESTFQAVAGLNIDSFSGRLKVSDRAQIGTRPTGNYLLEDDTALPPIRVTTDDGSFTVAITDAAGNASATSVAAKVWRDGNRMNMVFRDYEAIDTTGLTAADTFRIPLPKTCKSEYATGRIVLQLLQSPPTGGTATNDQFQVVCNLNASHATVRLVDPVSNAPSLQVQHMSGASIKEFRLEWDVA